MTLTDQLKISANKMLSIYLINADTKPEITEKVYAMGKAIGHKLGSRSKATKWKQETESRWKKPAARFNKEKEVINLILVRQREEIHQNMDEQEVETEVEVPEKIRTWGFWRSLRPLLHHTSSAHNSHSAPEPLSL